MQADLHIRLHHLPLLGLASICKLKFFCMKPILIFSFRAYMLVHIALLGTLLFASCSHKIGFGPSSVVPAAEGNVKVKKDDNNNYKVEVRLTHLAPADRLQPPRTAYVVWIETEQSGIKNIGRLNSETGFLSGKLKAELTTVTPFKPTRLFITAEDDARITYPSALVVLSTERFN